VVSQGPNSYFFPRYLLLTVGAAQAAVLRPRYRLSEVRHVRSLTVFLLTRAFYGLVKDIRTGGHGVFILHPPLVFVADEATVTKWL
jgi:hypothetical protein